MERRDLRRNRVTISRDNHAFNRSYETEMRIARMDFDTDTQGRCRSHT
ncbi:hypothetical protein AKJ09_02211 [Labilithrix luteola]|uniref:Uncharacterized protein n=1 Tax=Labilithrix luteola TaxID=1391654 RepID=A0A0K1PPV0_9BACT|nr:hypothetical protein AKJ09_02211 [Labilithrix luteola]